MLWLVSNQLRSAGGLVCLSVCLCLGCDAQTTSTTIQMDASFRFADASPRVDLATPSFDDGGAQLDVGSLPGDSGAVTDSGLLHDVSVSMDAAAAMDAWVEDAGAIVPPIDMALPEPGPDCGEQAFVDLNDEAERNGDVWLFDGEVRQDRFRGSCTTAGTRGADAVMRFRVPSAGDWRFDTVGSVVDTDLYLRSVCRDAESERACNADVNLPAGMTHSRLVERLREGEYVFIIVDSYNGLSRNPFRITIQPHEPLPQPSLISLRAIPLPEEEKLVILVTGRTEGSAPTLIHFVALGPDDEVRGRRRYVPVGEVDETDGAFAFVSVVDWSAQDHELMSRLRLQLVDEDGEESEWLNAVPTSLEEAGDLGGLCHPQSLVCPEGQVCARHLCRSRSQMEACPDEWEVTRLAPDAFGRSIFLGDNSEAPGLWTGSCGGGNATQVYRYLPENDLRALVSVVAAGEDAQPVLYARSLCAFEEAPSTEEIACSEVPAEQVSDPAGGQASFVLDLRAQRPVFLFVDSSGRGGLARWRGDYRLQITPMVTPLIDAAISVRDGGTGRIAVFFDVVDTDFESAFLRLFDAGGALIEFEEGNFDWPMELTAEQFENGRHRAYALLSAPGNLRLLAARRAELLIRDRLGLTSDPAELAFQPSQNREAGDSCDPSGLVHQCTEPANTCEDAPWPVCIESPE